ncbi:MAG TPA: exodeoxyribonuclease VII small subunit [Burkholderiaceae bacterium]|nr:exodeoxyribonuclease VII small subunit [Burkholderiaceae bacterium]
MATKVKSVDALSGKATPNQELPATYEAALQELDALVTQLEAGQLPLDQLMAGYQRGASLLTFCRDKLAAVEQQISVIENGELKSWTKQ